MAKKNGNRDNAEPGQHVHIRHEMQRVLQQDDDGQRKT
jgi:hypothetical protein